MAVALTATLSEAQSDPFGLTAIAVHINRTPKQSWPGYGIYLGNGLVLTAAHVAGDVAETKPHVIIAGQDLPATLVKQGSLDSVDLTLLSIDGAKLPVDLQMRRTPLCGHPPFAGERVVVAIPEGTAPSKILPRRAIPPDLRGRFDTAIAGPSSASTTAPLPSHPRARRRRRTRSRGEARLAHRRDELARWPRPVGSDAGRRG